MKGCRGCGASVFTKVLDLGKQPWCNDFLKYEDLGKEKLYPLCMIHCDECGLLQLNHTVSKEVMFADHQYLSGMTRTLVKHFYNIAKENKEQFKLQENDLIVDIGGNDGSQLLQYKKLGLDNVLNIESAANICEISEQVGILTLNAFFNKTVAQSKFNKGSARLINASGVFFHLEELHSVIEGIKYILSQDGVFIVQFMYAGAMIENHNFDTIYHEHLCYYTLRSLMNLLRPYGLEVFDAYHSDIHSGSIIAKITHTDGDLNEKTERFALVLGQDMKYTLEEFLSFAKAVEGKKNNLRDLLIHLKSEGKKVYAYGAPAKGNTLLNYFGITKDLVAKAVEINELKIGNYLPQSHIPITKESKSDLPDYYLLLSHNFAKEIIAKNQDIMEKGVKFILPFPEVEIVGAQ